MILLLSRYASNSAVIMVAHILQNLEILCPAILFIKLLQKGRHVSLPVVHPAPAPPRGWVNAVRTKVYTLPACSIWEMYGANGGWAGRNCTPLCCLLPPFQELHARGPCSPHPMVGMWLMSAAHFRFTLKSYKTLHCFAFIKCLFEGTHPQQKHQYSNFCKSISACHQVWWKIKLLLHIQQA